ncbi:PilN domain-containing protein [Ectothiorhodospira variabilis]|uniref:PilN domain-containing protein n=1 Tax=Ectothiorhodospira variabilis TaxID=505694 RepID=UPI001EFA4E12|nr:PilN domain-containing protein [Ectothiorhodospira variabilis]MCG5495865.1 PilN domain-containing protein [Ectothiorhodospira variabilis]MCG5505266.1 PilN domain-containing protein [Ectothiorhodospira variabilis]MCG5508423.1 PilN domain-containing protein [Ectothiorhodospira variabilis]
MRQHINLYRVQARQNRLWFSAQNMLVGAGILVALLAGYSLVEAQRLASLEQALNEARQDEEHALETLEQLREGRRAARGTEALREEIDTLTARRDQLTRGVRGLQRHIPETGMDLRAPLEALARADQPGLWLTRVTLNDQGRGLTLEGQALASRVIPAYLSTLAEEDTLSGLRFNQVRVYQPDDTLPGVRFVISTNTGSQR